MSVKSEEGTERNEAKQSVDDRGYGEAKKLPQIIAALSATLGSFGLGTALAWTSPALPHIEADICAPVDDCDITGVSKAEGSWIGAVLALGAMVSGPVTGYLVGRMGRKWTMISYSIPFAIGYLLFLLAAGVDDDISIYFGRLLTGFAGGAFALVAPLYIVEIAETSMRGALASLMQFMVTIGIAFVDGLNVQDAVHWDIISGICVLVPVLLAVAMFMMPESPYYLVSRGRDERALRSLRWLRGLEYNSEKELKDIKTAYQAESEIGSISIKTLLTERVYVRPFIIVSLLMMFQQFSGVNVVIFYAQVIFRDAGSDIDPGLSSFIVAIAQVVGTGIAVAIVEKFGRKILLFVSDLFMCISILLLGVFFYLKENSTVTCTAIQISEGCVAKSGDFDEQLIKDLGWLPLVSLIVYIIAFSIGFGPLPWTVNAEIFPAEARQLASSLAFAFNWFCAFLVTKFEPDLEDAIGASGAYFLFAAICGLGTVFVFVFLPETKGKTPQELKALFEKK